MITLIMIACDWPFNPKPTDEIFTVTGEADSSRIILQSTVRLYWDEITVENFRDIRIERRTEMDSVWTLAARIRNPFITTYIDTITDDEDLTYRVGFEDSLYNIRWAYAEVAVPKTTRISIPGDTDSLRLAYNLPVLDEGDTLLVGPGKYFGGFQFGKGVHVMAQGTWDDVILDGKFLYRVVQISAGELVGFKIQFGATAFSTPGGGIYLSGNARVRNCFITDNQASGPGGGVLLTGNGSLYNCLILRNSGQGVVTTNAHGNIINCTVVNNSIVIGAYCDSLTVRNNIITSSVSPFYDHSEYLEKITLDYNLLLDSTLGTNNISGDPEFIGTGDYHLQDTSPGIHAGHPGVEYLNRDGTRNTMGAFGGPFGE
ncbi:MAG: right-handed parallel beta-helix repeat-containing protein [FCB group bacterium]|nr:right-handed parallel beta-helix repeat-containing protein [FCB group bacterium]